MRGGSRDVRGSRDVGGSYDVRGSCDVRGSRESLTLGTRAGVVNQNNTFKLFTPLCHALVAASFYALARTDTGSTAM